MGLIQNHGGIFELQTIKGIQVYESNQSNGVSSKNRKGDQDVNGFTVQAVENHKVVKMNEYQKMQKVDIYDENKAEWLMGVIIDIKTESAGHIKVEIAKTGYSE